MSRGRLDELTRRWRERHEVRRPAAGDRPVASPERQGMAARAFPYRSTSPATYVERHGADMVAFTYDDERYADPELDAWIAEVGQLLRRERP